MSSPTGYVKITPSNLLGESKKNRFDRIIKLMKEKNNLTPDWVVVMPGRINLIGEHIDYHGFAVLPMAIEKSLWMACCFTKNFGSSKSKLTLHNNDSKHHTWWGYNSFSYGSSLSRTHSWQNYFLCGYHGVLVESMLNTDKTSLVEHAQQIIGDPNLLETTDNLLSNLLNFEIFIDSDLPEASGLSSSSALTCASAVATTLLIHESHKSCSGKEDDILLDIYKLADNCSRFEHLVGTHGGGMDQAVIMTAQEGFAKYVNFVPKLDCENIRLPESVVWLVSQSGVTFSKAATSSFNTRVLETKIGAVLIAKEMGTSIEDIKIGITLGDVKRQYFPDKSTLEIVKHVRQNIFHDKNELEVDEMCLKLGIARQDFERRFGISNNFLKIEYNDKLTILSRCEHVFEEAERVEKFKSLCDTTMDVAMLGQLLTQSHYSLRDKYECSHPALDRLVGVALDAGALGSRLTGAGWGGCVITLVELNKCESVLGRLKEVSEFTFQTKPQSGCQVIQVEKQ